MVRAYKGLIKEKEALELSLRALSGTPSRDQSRDPSAPGRNEVSSEGEVSEGEVSVTESERHKPGERVCSAWLVGCGYMYPCPSVCLFLRRGS